MQPFYGVFVPLGKFLVCRWAPDFTGIYRNGLYNGFNNFKTDFDWDVNFNISFDGVKSPSCLVSQVICNFLEVACGADV